MEVLVVLLIIGIITNLALPKLLPTITKAKTMEAKLQLSHIYTLEKNFHFENSRYSSSLQELSFEQEPLVTNGGKANYRISITSSGTQAFKATATSVTDFDNDGIFNTWEINHEQKLIETIPD